MYGMTNTCKKCESPLESHTERTPACTVCVRYKALVSNANHARRGGTSPGVSITLREFAAWFATQPRICSFCSIPEALVPHLDLRTQVGLPLQRLGIDRKACDAGYELDSIHLCCFACNKARSNTFGLTEMFAIGRSIAGVWTERLAKKGIVWSAADAGTGGRDELV